MTKLLSSPICVVRTDSPFCCRHMNEFPTLRRYRYSSSGSGSGGGSGSNSSSNIISISISISIILAIILTIIIVIIFIWLNQRSRWNISHDHIVNLGGLVPSVVFGKYTAKRNSIKALDGAVHKWRHAPGGRGSNILWRCVTRGRGCWECDVT